MSVLNIIVCVKQIPDPEGPTGAFKVDSENKTVTPVGIPPMLNPFDENALEAALRIKDQHSARVTVISMGPRLARPVLKKTIAAGADALMLLADPMFADLDSESTAYVLSTAIKKIGDYDLIFTGRQAGDWDFGVTGLILAEMLGLPAANPARNVDVLGDGKGVQVEQLTSKGYDVLKMPFPALVSVSNEVGELRPTSIKAMAASGSKMKVFNAEDMEINVEKLKKRSIFDLAAAHHNRECHLLVGDSVPETCRKMACRLRDDQVL